MVKILGANHGSRVCQEQDTTVQQLWTVVLVRYREGAGGGDSVASANVTFLSNSHDSCEPARSRAPWTAAASRLEHYNDAEPSEVVMSNVEIQSQIRANTPEIEGSQVKELVAIRCIADDSAADHGHKRCDSPPHALFSQALCVPDVPASQPSSEVPVCGRLHLGCLLLAPRRRAAPSREKELFDMFPSQTLVARRVRDVL